MPNKGRYKRNKKSDKDKKRNRVVDIISSIIARILISSTIAVPIFLIFCLFFFNISDYTYREALGIYNHKVTYSKGKYGSDYLWVYSYRLCDGDTVRHKDYTYVGCSVGLQKKENERVLKVLCNKDDY